LELGSRVIQDLLKTILKLALAGSLLDSARFGVAGLSTLEVAGLSTLEVAELIVW
jgi:hypothetical protein